MKNISYWSPILSNIATLSAVTNSAMSLARYSNDYNITLLNSVGEFEKLKNKSDKIKVYDLNKKLLKIKLIGVGFFKTRISMMIIFLKCFFSLKNYAFPYKNFFNNFTSLNFITVISIFII